MDLENLEKALKPISDAIIRAEARNQTNSYLLAAIIRERAQSFDDPHRYLADLFERVSTRMDQWPIETDPLQIEIHSTIEKFFVMVGQSIP